MTFAEAVRLVKEEDALMTRPSWPLLRLIARGYPHKRLPHLWDVDNFDSGLSGWSSLYEARDADRAATDWMFYQSPEENWLDLEFEDPIPQP
jgi:hypothetical protein